MTDESRAQDVIAGCSNWFDIQHYIVPRIVTALTTVRQEERRATFSEMFKVLCPDCAEGDEPTYDKQARWYYHGEDRHEVGCSASKLRIEATANDQKAPDGEQP